jgi:hypothetical protein
MPVTGGIDVSFVAGFGPIVRDIAQSRTLYSEVLGISFKEEKGGYLHTEALKGARTFALWPLSQAAHPDQKQARTLGANRQSFPVTRRIARGAHLHPGFAREEVGRSSRVRSARWPVHAWRVQSKIARLPAPVVRLFLEWAFEFGGKKTSQVSALR